MLEAVNQRQESINACQKAIEVYKSRPEDYAELIQKLEEFMQTRKSALEEEEMFQRRQTTEDYHMTSQAESDEEGEDNFDDKAKAASMSRTTIGIIGGLMTMISAFTFYKARQ